MSFAISLLAYKSTYDMVILQKFTLNNAYKLNLRLFIAPYPASDCCLRQIQDSSPTPPHVASMPLAALTVHLAPILAFPSTADFALQ